MTTRRHLIAGIAGLGCAFCARRATAGVGLGDLARMARNATLGERDEIEWGRSLFGPFVDAMGGAYRNGAVQRAVEQIARPMMATSVRPFAWEITVVDNAEVNAWALPGGKIGVHTGVLRYVDNEDELAAVIAHEMAHVELSHALKDLRGKALTGLALAGASAAGGNDRDASSAAGMVGANIGLFNLISSGYSRASERAADAAIPAIFARTGHDVARGAQFYQTLLEIIPERSEGRNSLFAGHPETRQRRDALLAKAGPASPPSPPKPAFTAIKSAFPTRKVWMRRPVAGRSR